MSSINDKLIKKKIKKTLCEFSYTCYTTSSSVMVDTEIELLGEKSRKQVINKIKKLYETDEVIIKSIEYKNDEYILPVDLFINESLKYMQLNNEN